MDLEKNTRRTLLAEVCWTCFDKGKVFGFFLQFLHYFLNHFPYYVLNSYEIGHDNFLFLFSDHLPLRT